MSQQHGITIADPTAVLSGARLRWDSWTYASMQPVAFLVAVQVFELRSNPSPDKPRSTWPLARTLAHSLPTKTATGAVVAQLEL